MFCLSAAMLGLLRLLGVADAAAPGPLSGRPAQKRREARAFLRQAAPATARSEKVSLERSVARPSLMVADFLVGRLGVVFAAGVAFG